MTAGALPANVVAGSCSTSSDDEVSIDDARTTLLGKSSTCPALEHLGVVVGEDVDRFSRVHRTALTGQQFQSPEVEPYYVLFEDFTHVKFYRRSLHDGVILQGATFDGFVHVDDWVSQRLVTATDATRMMPRPWSGA